MNTTRIFNDAFHMIVIKLDSQTQNLKGVLFPQVEMHFGTYEHAQKAAALLAHSKINDSKVSISEILFEEHGRKLLLKFKSFGAYPSEIVSFILGVVDVASAACPVWQHISIPLVQNH